MHEKQTLLLTTQGTVLKLGTAQHHDALLGAIDSLDATGCFALTELGFGAPRPPCCTPPFLMGIAPCMHVLQHALCMWGL